MTMFVVRHRREKSLLWQRGAGWVKSDPTVFNANDTHKYPLPPFGEWAEIPVLTLEHVPDAS